MNLKTLSLSALLTVSLLASCGNREDELFGEAGGDDEGSVMKVDTATGATIVGAVALDGGAAAPSPLDMSADAICAAGGTSAEGTGDVVAANGKLGNVFVYVSKGLEGKRFAAPKEAAMLDQKGCRYHPHVLGVMVGQPLKISNSDATVHNVHPTPKANKGFNIAQTSAGAVNEKVFTEPELMIPFSCDIHGWMRSYVGVMTHPFFGVSGKDGAFSLKGVPPGTYTVTAWHEKFGEQKQEVTVGAKESKNITFTFKAS
jgi:hypothetical protein